MLKSEKYASDLVNFLGFIKLKFHKLDEINFDLIISIFLLLSLTLQ